jgi:hypothetical protein
MTKKTAIILIVIAAIIAFIAGAWAFMGDYYEESEDTAYIPESCNVLGFAINGYLATYTSDNTTEKLEMDAVSSWNIADGIRRAKNYPNVKAVLLSIDSSGGDATTGEEIANALKAVEVPSVAVIRSIGASAAYWAATGADTVFASRISDVGSIGATASYFSQLVRSTNSVSETPVRFFMPRVTLSAAMGSIAWSKQHNLYRLQLQVQTSNKTACHLYQKYGFEIEGVLRCCAHIGGVYVDKFQMSLLL